MSWVCWKPKTNIEKIKLSKIALASGYKKFYLISKTENIKKTLKRFLNSSGPSFLEVKIKNVSMKNLEDQITLKI